MTVYFPHVSAARNRVQLLAVQKPIKRQGSWKGKFAFFGCQQSGDGGDACLKPDVPPDNHGARAFISRGRGPTCRNSTVSFESHLEIGHVVVRPATSWLF